MSPQVIPALSVVGVLAAIGTVMVSAIGVLRKPEPNSYKQIWLKMGLHITILLVLLGAGALGPAGMAPIGCFIAFRAWFELLRSIEGKYGPVAHRDLLIALGTLAALWGLAGAPHLVFLAAFGATWCALALPMLLDRRPPPLHGVLAAAFGMTFITTPLGLLMLLAGEGYGAYAFFLLVLMSHDGFSEGFGRLFGKKPLWPDISPGKTLGGTFGGIMASVLLGYLLRFLVPDWSLGHVLGVAAGVVVMAAVGDLIASSLKREAGIKDFGRILPTHGGVLDRVDSLLFTVPIFYAVARWIGGQPG